MTHVFSAAALVASHQWHAFFDHQGRYALALAPSFEARDLRSLPRSTPARRSGRRSGVHPKQGMPIFASVSASGSLNEGTPLSEMASRPTAFTPLSRRNSIFLRKRFVL